MHQFGLGVAQDLHTAKQHYHRCREVDPSGLHTPVTLVLLGLGVHMIYLRLLTWDKLFDRLFADIRMHILMVHLIAIIALAVLRWHFSRSRRPQQRQTPPPAAPQVAAAVPPAGVTRAPDN